MCEEVIQFTRRQAEIIVTGPDKASQFKSVWEKLDLPFIGIPDPKHVIASQYGQQVKILKLGRMPATVIIDKNSNIRFSQYGNSMKDTTSNELLFSVLDEINSEE